MKNNIGMKPMKRLTIITLFLICVSLIVTIQACDDKEGYADAPDFNRGPYQISAAGIDTVISASNTVDWQFLDLIIDGKQVLLSDQSIEVKSKRFSSDGPEVVNLITGQWFVLEKVDQHKLRFAVYHNDDESLRKLDITVHHGNGVRQISIQQQSK